MDKSAGKDECWPWIGNRIPQGYGQFGLTNERPLRAHRFAYELTYGPIPKGLFVCHKCDNPPCCNPKHLFLGTPRENSLDIFRKGRRNMSYENHPEHKLTWLLVEEMRQKYYLEGGFTKKALAKHFGVSASTAGAVLNGKQWLRADTTD